MKPNPKQDCINTTLETISEAPAFNQWMYQTIASYLHGNILEVGSGIGNISQFVVNGKKTIYLSDYDHNYVKLLHQKFESSPYVKNVWELDLSDNGFEQKFAQFSNYFDSIFLLNVLEHIENDRQAIANLKFLLKPGGNLIVLVPSYRLLYSEMDRSLGHYKRYTISSLKSKIQENSLIVTKAFYFNALGIAGWLWNKLLKKAEISYGNMNLFNRLVPLAKVMDKLLFHRIGLSTIVIAKKAERL